MNYKSLILGFLVLALLFFSGCIDITPEPTTTTTKMTTTLITTTTELTTTTAPTTTLPPRCKKEGEQVNRNPLIGPTDEVCCPGLKEIRVSKSYGICVNCGDGICQEPEDEGNCPEDCGGI